MEAINTILHRKSIRRFSTQEIRNETIKEILRAAMAGPTAVNARDFSFIVVKNKDRLMEMHHACGAASAPLKDAMAAILVCGDLDRAYKNAKDYWIIDCSISAQNICLASYDLGIGNVWLGVYPQLDRVKNLSDIFQLPKTIIPHSIIALGYPEDEFDMKKLTEEEIDNKYEEDRVHYETW